ncbi:MAG: cytochrome c3 family protein, partial [Coriobacteriia bacterium]
MADLMRRTIVAGALALALAAGAQGAAHAAKPTKPSLHEAFPSGSNQVTLRWERSTDASATHTITYEIYRSKVPIQQSMITPGLSPLVSVVTPVSLTSSEPTWTAVVAADVAGGEVSDVYVWHYAVRARDSAGVFSDISPTLAPNLHGGRGDANVATCQRCHKIHGSLTPGVIDRSSWTCYHCHGRADGSSSGPGDRSTMNAKADFYDYGNLPPGGSQHRSAKMTAANQQCRACHTPHRASYFFFTADGTSVLYDALRSFRRMLRVQTGLSATSKPTYTGGYYGRNDNTAEDTSFCFSCHGSATASPGDGSAETNMGYVSDGGYAATGGDHNEAGYATAIHGPGVIFSNDRGRAREGDFPQIQCLACHDKHASAADKLIAYRGQDTTASASGTYAQAELCFACHAAGSTENKVAAGHTAPFSWNNRDVKAQFAKASRHPTATSGGRWVAKTGTVFSQTTQAEFATNTLFQTSTALVPGSVVLAQQSANVYFTTGTITTGDIATPGRPTAWGNLSWTEAEPVNTALSVTVQGWNGTSWVSLVTGATSPVSLSGYSAATYTKLRLVGNLTTSDTASTPRLDDWTVTGNWDDFESGYYVGTTWVSQSSLTCASCHNVHYAQRGSTTAAWDMARVSSPSNTKLTYTGTATALCLECHDGAPPTTWANSASTIVPYSVGFRIFGAGQAPLFTGWNKKTASGAEFVNSAHATTA